MPSSLKAAAAATAGEPPSGITPAAVFLRQRYPDLRFEIYVDHPSYELRNLLSGKASTNVVNSTWKAYLRASSGAPNFSVSFINIYFRICRGRAMLATRADSPSRPHGRIWASVRRSGSLHRLSTDCFPYICRGEDHRA
jgi:hypothetical protein